MTLLKSMLVVLLIGFWTCSAQGKPDQDINASIDVLPDNNHNWSLDSVLSPARWREFDNSPLVQAYFGYTTKPYWLRIQIPEASRGVETYIIVDTPGIFDVVLYDRSRVYVSGRKYPLGSWQVKARNTVFRLEADPGRRVVYMRVQEEGSLMVPVAVKTAGQYERSKLVEFTLFGAFLGLVVAMVLYNLMLFFTLKDVSYLFYVLAMLAGAFVSLIRIGYATTYFWPGLPQIDGQMYLIGAGISIFASARFTSHFLLFPKVSPRTNYYLWGIAGMGLMMVLLTFFFSFVELTTYGRLLVIVAFPSFLFLGIRTYLSGNNSALYFTMAFIPYMVGVVLIVLKGGGWIQYHPAVDHSAEIGTALEAMLLSLALADRINAYRKAKAEAELKTLNSQLENQQLVIKNQELDHDLMLKERDLEHEKKQLATSTLWLTQKNQLLQEIKDLLHKPSSNQDQFRSKEISKMIDANLNAEEDWDRFKIHFEKVHSGFFAALKRDTPDLTANEERICAYIRMNLNSKEIARLLNITPDSVKKSRQRLRKKLNLSDDDRDLLGYLLALN